MSAALLWLAASPLAVAPREQLVQVQMQNVMLRVDQATVIHIVRLRGELVTTRAGQPPVFDDKGSFVVRIDSAEIAISNDSLSRLMNNYVFNYDGSPLKRLAIATDGTRLKVSGTIRKGINVPFSMDSDAKVDPNGELRLQPRTIKALGMPAKGLLSFFGIELDNLVKVRQSRGVRLDGDDFVLNPNTLLPPPRIEGHLQAIRVEPGRIVQIFGPGKKPPLTLSDPNARNYMYYRGGVLRFGKLTMDDADLALIDAQPQDPFDFFQDRYNDQLVAGYSKNTPQHGLNVYMPDFHRLKQAS